MCKFVFDANEWENNHELESPVDGIWSCPHETYLDADHCIFHLTEGEKGTYQPTQSAYYDEYRNKIDDRGRKPKQFIGAEIPELDLHSDKIDSPDTHPINFAHSQIGAVKIHSSEFEQLLLFSHAEIEKWDALDTVFRKKCYFDGVNFNGLVDFSRAQFNAPAIFSGAQFNSQPLFLMTTFQHAIFQGSVFKDGANFFSSEFTDGVSFNNCYLGESAFGDVAVDGKAMFQSVSIEGKLDMNHFKCKDIYLDFYSPSLAVVELTGSKLEGFSLRCPPNENILFNMMFCQVGRGTIKCPNTDINPLYSVFFRDTEFRGFDFAKFHEELKDANWNLHTVNDRFEDYIGTPSEIDTEYLESTYNKARMSASSTKNNKAASEFFLKEQRFRRKTHLKRGAFFRWASNLTFDLTAGYGERTSRVIMTSLTTIILFAETYGVLFNYQGDVWHHILLSYTTSFQSFVTLVFGGGKELSRPEIRFLASFEGFLGAFLIALFVFALTKSAAR